MANTKISALTAATTPLAGTEVLPVVQSGVTKQVSVANLTAGRAVTVDSLTVTSGSVNLGAGGANGFISGGTWYGINSGNWVFQAGNASQAFRWNGSSGSVRMFLDNNNNLLLGTASSPAGSGHFLISNGNVIQGTAATGFNFTANTPASGMTSQLLNWYEEGTWGPGIASSGTTVGTGAEYGTYVKIGRMVYASFSLNAYTTGGTQTNALQITGLPFTVKNVSGNNAGHGVIINMATTGFLRATKNATTIDIYQGDGTAITPTTAGINNTTIRNLNGTVVYYSST